jgi:molybdopterin synthase catalytic subunit
MSSQQDKPQLAKDDGIAVLLTHLPLDITSVISAVKSPKAGAIVLFAGGHVSTGLSVIYSNNLVGTTRDNFDGKPVKQLKYTAYAPRALKTMLDIAQAVKKKHALTAISIVHRLGIVPIGEESILIAVASPHRQAAWKAGEEALEECKLKVEVWKFEDFGAEDGGMWRANRDGAPGVPIDGAELRGT